MAKQKASALHSMEVLQVFQAKLPNSKPADCSELRSATDLAKMTAQAIGRSMSSLVVLERHLWFNLMEMKDSDKIPLLDSPVSPTACLVMQ